MIYKSNTGVEITNNLGFGFIKSGFESIKSDFEADLRRYGLEVMRAASIVMDPAVVNFIYRDSRESFFYPSMYRHLTTTAVVAMALEGEDDNTQDILIDLKLGLNGRPNLREKYAIYQEPVPDDEVELWIKGEHPNEAEITRRMTQANVFHAADSVEEAKISLQLIDRYNPEFWFKVDE